jgi:uncharacterized protein (DUF1684 family)
MSRMLLLLLAGGTMAAAADYPSELAAWRRDREAKLKADGGWLSVAGLFWLTEGANRFGAAPSNDIVLPDGPPNAGAFNLRQGKVTVAMNGTTRTVANDFPDAVKIGRLSLFLIKRGDKFGIRLKDPEAATRRNFRGIDYFPPKESLRITARFVAEPKKIGILNVLGQTEASECPGYVVFRLDGKEHRLYPILEEPGAKTLFFIFRDPTAGKETYGAGRFLDTDLPKDGKVILDFNKAYNPPCVFTDYATCPLPPKVNHLSVRIEAGEKKYH